MSTTRPDPAELFTASASCSRNRRFRSILARLASRDGMSTKHRKALARAATDNRIQIIDEDQFVCLLAGTVTSDAPVAHSDDDASHHRPAHA